MEQVLSNHGAGAGDRTPDLLITSPSTAREGAATRSNESAAPAVEARPGATENGEPGKDTGKDEAERIRAAVAGRYPGDRIETGPFPGDGEKCAKCGGGRTNWLCQECFVKQNPDVRLCPCGTPSDGWPGEGEAELCQSCWEEYCNKTWWAAVNTRALVADAEPPSRWRGVILTGGVVAGPYGTETQTPHEQASFADITKADEWITGRVAATRRVGILLVERVEALRVYKPEPKPAPAKA